jgi:hypothetical protein
MIEGFMVTRGGNEYEEAVQMSAARHEEKTGRVANTVYVHPDELDEIATFYDMAYPPEQPILHLWGVKLKPLESVGRINYLATYEDEAVPT